MASSYPMPNIYTRKQGPPKEESSGCMIASLLHIRSKSTSTKIQQPTQESTTNIRNSGETSYTIDELKETAQDGAKTKGSSPDLI